MAKKHGLKEILSHEAITKSVDYIWNEGIFLKYWNNFQWLRPLNVPRRLFIVNVLTDFLFFVLLSLMMLTGMCVKGTEFSPEKNENSLHMRFLIYKFTIANIFNRILHVNQ